MKSIFQKIFQGSSIVAQVLNEYGGLVPAKYQPQVAIAIGVAQGVVGILGHFYTPSGQKIAPIFTK